MQPSNWTALSHAYGPAGDIPALLGAARVAPPPRDHRDEPWFSLWSALCHQGDVYTASYAAVPELIAIAEQRRPDTRASCECLFIAAIIELERAAPQGSPPPAIPPELLPPYSRALQLGTSLATRALRSDSEPDVRAMFEICAAVFAGDFARARLLTDGPDEDETA